MAQTEKDIETIVIGSVALDVGWLLGQIASNTVQAHLELFPLNHHYYESQKKKDEQNITLVPTKEREQNSKTYYTNILQLVRLVRLIL